MNTALVQPRGLYVKRLLASFTFDPSPHLY